VISPLRILFVCSGAAPGCDGVGDYSRRLAEELRKRGHFAAILALNDRLVENSPRLLENELRLSASLPWRKRLVAAKKFASEFRPNLWSLQFVGYGFDSRGLPLGLAKRLRHLGGNEIWHAMFHELWVERGGGWKFQILSRLQAALVLQLCRTLKPSIIHTSNISYKKRLADAGVASSILPLFGNIPPVPTDIKTDPSHWVFAFFGSIRRGWEPEPLLSRIEEARVCTGKTKCRFISIGRLGEFGDKIWSSMERSGYEHFVFEKRGELCPGDVSRELQSANFGIAVSPLDILGKSGAVAAMREHGLPVVVNRFDKPLPDDNFASLHDLILMDGQFSENLSAATKEPCHDRLPDVAGEFLRSILASK